MLALDGTGLLYPDFGSIVCGPHTSDGQYLMQAPPARLTLGTNERHCSPRAVVLVETGRSRGTPALEQGQAARRGQRKRRCPPSRLPPQRADMPPDLAYYSPHGCPLILLADERVQAQRARPPVAHLRDGPAAARAEVVEQPRAPSRCRPRSRGPGSRAPTGTRTCLWLAAW
jgi:hypothetical protein